MKTVIRISNYLDATFRDTPQISKKIICNTDDVEGIWSGAKRYAH